MSSTNLPDMQPRHVVDKDIDTRIFELEAKAADSDMIACLTTDEEVRIYNRGLARKLRDHVARLRNQRDSAKLRSW